MTNMKLPFPIVPAAAGQPSHYSSYGAGGLHTVATESDLASFPEGLKETGMLCFVRDTQAIWFWSGTEWVNLDIAKGSLITGDITDLVNELTWKEYE